MRQLCHAATGQHLRILWGECFLHADTVAQGRCNVKSDYTQKRLTLCTTGTIVEASQQENT